MFAQITSPARFLSKKFRPGGLKGSIFSLIAACLGAGKAARTDLCAGTLSIPYLMLRNGVLIGVFLVLFGAIISFYTGMLLVSTSDKVGSDRYEDIAEKAFGNKMARFTSICNIICLLGFDIAYVVFVSQAHRAHVAQVKVHLPGVLTTICGELPTLINNKQWEGQLFWAILYSVYSENSLSLTT